MPLTSASPGFHAPTVVYAQLLAMGVTGVYACLMANATTCLCAEVIEAIYVTIALAGPVPLLVHVATILSALTIIAGRSWAEAATVQAITNAPVIDASQEIFLDLPATDHCSNYYGKQ